MDNAVKRIAKNSSYVFLGNFIAGIIVLAANIYIARYLGKEMFGSYSFVFAFISFFLILANLGIDGVVSRDIARNPRKSAEYISNSFMLKTFLSLASLIAAIVLVYILPYDGSIRLGVFFYAFTLILMAYTATFTSFFQARLEMVYVGASNIASKITLIILVFYVMQTNGGFVKLIIASLISIGMQTAILFYFTAKKTKINFSVNWRLAKHLAVESLPFAMVGIFLTIYSRLDVFMLSLLKNQAAIGIYSAAYNLTESPSIIPVALMASMMPLMARYFKSSKSLLKKTYKLSMKYTLMVAFPLAAGTCMLSRYIVGYIYKNEFIDSYLPLSLLIWATFFMFIGIVNSNTLVATNRHRIFAAIVGTSLVFNIVLNILLIPKFSYAGASVSAVITQMVGAILGTIVLSYGGLRFPFRDFFKIGISSVTMGAGIYFMIYFGINPFLMVFLSVIIYIIMLFITKSIESEERDIIKSLIAAR